MTKAEELNVKISLTALIKPACLKCMISHLRHGPDHQPDRLMKKAASPTIVSFCKDILTTIAAQALLRSRWPLGRRFSRRWKRRPGNC